MNSPSFDYDERDRARQDDEAFFERNLDREYRIRRAWPCEYGGERPSGFEAFAIVHRQDVAREWRHTQFGARVTLNTDQTDAAIREMLLALSADPRAMLKK